MLCCTGSRREWTAEEVEAQLSPRAVKNKNLPDLNIHPWDSTVNLSVHQPLYPPGKIIHIVRYYPKPMDTMDIEQRWANSINLNFRFFCEIKKNLFLKTSKYHVKVRYKLACFFEVINCMYPKNFWNTLDFFWKASEFASKIKFLILSLIILSDQLFLHALNWIFFLGSRMPIVWIITFWPRSVITICSVSKNWVHRSPCPLLKQYFSHLFHSREL